MSSQRGTTKGTGAKRGTGRRTASKGTTRRRSGAAEQSQGNSPWQWSNFLGLAPTLILVIVFALPLKTVPLQATETYWDTEMRSEPYTVTESYTDVEPYVTTETRTKTVYDSYYGGGYGCWDGSCAWDGCYPYYDPCYSPYYCSDNTTCSAVYSWRPRPRVVSYPEEVTKYRTVTKYRDVIEYRDVPTQVLKERTVTQYVRMSIWEYLFM